MPTELATVIGGVDTHKHTHYAAVIDEHGRLLGHSSSRPLTPATSNCWPGCAATGASTRSASRAPAPSAQH